MKRLVLYFPALLYEILFLSMLYIVTFDEKQLKTNKKKTLRFYNFSVCNLKATIQQQQSNAPSHILFVEAHEEEEYVHFDKEYVHFDKDKHRVKFEPKQPKKLAANDPVFGVVHFTCPPNFTLIERRCVQSQVTAPIVSCPYGSYRDEQANCVSVDSVPVERACPPGFESYDKGCMKRHLLDAVATCPLGYYKDPESLSHCKTLKKDKPQLLCSEGVLEGNECVTTKFSEAKPRCPHGYKFNKGKCFKWIKLHPLYTCPEDYTTSTLPNTNNITCSKVIETKAIPVCHDGFVLEGEVCVKNRFFPKLPRCKEGFVLSADTKQCTRITASNAIPYCKDGWQYDSITQKCSIMLHEDPLFACQVGMDGMHPMMVQPHKAGEFGMHDCVTLEVQHPELICERGEPIDRIDSENNDISSAIINSIINMSGNSSTDGLLEKLQQMATPIKEKLSKKQAAVDVGMQCLERLVKAPDYASGCPHDSVGMTTNANGEAVCMQVHNVEAEATCEEGATMERGGISLGLESSNISILTLSDEEELKHAGLKNVFNEDRGDRVCSKYDSVDIIFVCEDGSIPTESFTTCKQSRMYEPEYLCPKGMLLDKKNHLCLGEHIEELLYDCPSGYVMHGSTTKQGDKPQKLKHIIPPSSNPIPYIEYKSTLKQNIKKYESKLKKLDEEIYHTGVCERVEYATVQVVCPVGYKMQAKKDKGKGCIAEKPVPHTKICEPGFFMEGGKCVKHVEIAPSLINLEGNPIACKIRESGDLSCGHSYQYHPSLKEHKLGNGFADM